MSLMAEQLVRATLARLEADRQEAIAVIELYLNNPVGIAEHSGVVAEVAAAVTRLAEAEDAIGAVHRNFLNTEGDTETGGAFDDE